MKSKKNFHINRDSIPLENQEQIFNELVEERASIFTDLKNKIDSANLIFKFKTERRSLKDFRDYQNLVALF